MCVLVSVASRHGATEEIAEAGDVADVHPYDACALGSASCEDRWLEEVRELTARTGLRQRPVWLGSNGPIRSTCDPSWATVRECGAAVARDLLTERPLAARTQVSR